MRVTIANADRPRASGRDVYARFIAAYRETIDWMYAGDAAIAAFAQICRDLERDGEDRARPFYPKSMLQLDQVTGLAELMQDAIAFKYIPQALTRPQLDELVQTRVKP